MRYVWPQALLLKNTGCPVIYCGDRNENFFHSCGCSLAACRLYQQQQSTTTGENYRYRAAQLHHHGGMSGRNKTALPVNLRAVGQLTGGRRSA